MRKERKKERKREKQRHWKGKHFNQIKLPKLNRGKDGACWKWFNIYACVMYSPTQFTCRWINGLWMKSLSCLCQTIQTFLFLLLLFSLLLVISHNAWCSRNNGVEHSIFFFTSFILILFPFKLISLSFFLFFFCSNFRFRFLFFFVSKRGREKGKER